MTTRHVMSSPGIARQSRATAVLGRFAIVAALAGLTGCGGVDGVELNGKLFEAVGLTGSLGGKKAEPRTEARAPLVLPPPSQSLTEPGRLAAGAPIPQADQAWPNDPEKGKAQKEEALRQAQEAYCRDGNWKDKALNNDGKAANGPAGSCTGNIFSIVGKSILGE